jgi:hypothetical protein
MKRTLTHQFRHLGAFAIAIIALFSINASAGPLQKSRVAADAQWLAHVDITGLLNSTVIKFILENGQDMHVEMDGIEEMKEQFGLDPLKDFKDITIYGKGNPEKDGSFVALITTTSAVDSALDAFKTQEPDAVHELEVGGYRIQSAGKEGEKMFFRIQPGPEGADRLVVISKDPENLVRGISVTEGKSPNLAGSAGPALLRSPQPGSLSFFAANGLDWLDDDEEGSKLLRDAESLVLEYGEKGDETFLESAIVTKNAEDSANLADMARGLLAMGKMAASNDPELAPFKDALNAAKITTEGGTISFKLRLPTQKLIDTLKSAAAAEKQAEDDEKDADDENAAVEQKKDVTRPKKEDK